MAQKLTDYLLENPLYAYGQQQAAQGASTAPVYSPWQGLARALQGGLGGLFAGQAVQDAKGEQSLDRAALAKAMSATTPEAQDAAIASRPGVAEEAALPIMLQRSAARTKFEFEQKGIDADKTAFGLGGAAAGPAVGTGGAPAGGAAPDPQFVQNMMPHAQAVSQVTGMDPRLVVAHTALETGNGAHAPGNNYFGIKGGNGPALATKEADANGNLAPTQAQFRSYGSPAESAKDYANLIATDPHYAGLRDVIKNGGDVNAQIDALAKSGYATDPNFGPKLRQIVQNMPAAGAAPVGAGLGIAPGAPQTALNVPAPQAGGAMTTLKGGLQVPTAALNAALGIRDADKRHEKFTGIIQDAIKMQREGVPLIDIRQADGSTIKVPQAQAAGMRSAREMPLPGNKEADVNMLQTGDPASAEYAAAHARIGMPQMSQGGQLLYPPMDAYRAPAGAKPVPGPTFKDTPASNTQIEKDLRGEFQKHPVVENYEKAKPLLEAMKLAKEQPGVASDMNLYTALGSLYSGGSGLPRGEMLEKITKAEGLTGELKTALGNAINGRGLDPEVKQRLIDAAMARVAPLKAEYDARAKQYGEIADRKGVDRQNVLIAPSAAPAAKEGEGKKGGPIRIDINGNPL